MVNRTFFAFDSEALLVTTDVGGELIDVGDPIINNSDTPIGTEWTFQPGFQAQFVTVDDDFDDNGNPIDVFDDDEIASHVIVDGAGLVTNGTAVESESVHTIQAVDENGNLVGEAFDIFVFSEGGVTQDVWGFGTTVPLEPGVTYRKVGGSNTGDSVYTALVCFADGCALRTPRGYVDVADLAVGDAVVVETGEVRRIRWIGSREVEATGRFAPVRFAEGAVGNAEAFSVSPQHRMLLSGPTAQLMFGAERVLAPALALTALEGVKRVEGGRVTYRHVLFDRHELVDCCGALTESFHPGATALSSLDESSREEVLTLFPELAAAGTDMPTAAPVLRSFEAMALANTLSNAGRA